MNEGEGEELLPSPLLIKKGMEYLMDLIVYGKKVSFSKEEADIFAANSLDLDGEFVELMLHWIGIDGFGNESSEEAHNLCINAIQSYAKDTSDAVNFAKGEGLL